ncbi:MAG: hypothetical protein AAFY13_11255 [Pseudomonadota bacterium]
MGSLGSVLAGMIVAIAGVRFGQYLERRALAQRRDHRGAAAGSGPTPEAGQRAHKIIDAKADPATGTFKTGRL